MPTTSAAPMTTEVQTLLLLLEALTRWDAEIWLRLQARWDLWHAVQARGPRPKVRALPRSA